MPTLRIPFAEPLTNRDSTTTKDSKLTNCFSQTVGGQNVVVKRPGLLAAIQGNVGQGQGAYCYNNFTYNISGDILTTTGYVAPPPNITFTSSTATTNQPISTVISGNYCYVISANGNTFQIFNISNPASPTLIGSIATYTSPNCLVVSGSRAYIINDYYNNSYLATYDISIPASPTLIGSVLAQSGGVVGQNNAITLFGIYIYQMDVSGNIKVYNISFGTPLLVNTISSFTNSGRYSLFISQGYLYLSSNTGSVYIYSLAIPTAPSLVGSVVAASQAIVVSGNYAYASDSSTGTVYVIDVTTKATPTIIQTLGSGVIGGTPIQLVISNNYLFVLSNNGGFIKAVNITTPGAATVQSTFSITANFVSIAIGGTNMAIVNLLTATLEILNTGQTPVLTTSNYPLNASPSSYQWSHLGAGSTLTLFKSNTNLYTFDSSTGVITYLSPTNYPATTVPGIVYLDGTFYVATSDAKIYGSNIEDPTTWSALNYISAEIEPDGLVAIEKSLNYLVAFGQWTTEFFYDAGNPTGSPLSSVPNAFFTVGCASGTSVVRMENEVVWMSQTIQRGRQIMALSGFTPSIISTPEVDRILNADDLATVYAFSIKISGSVFYVLTLKTSAITLVYDFTTKQWHFWTSITAQASKSITTITSTSGIATVTETAHSYADGDLVTIAGANEVGYNGSVNITYINANTYSYLAPLAIVTPATGTITSVGYTESYFNAVAYSFCSGSDLLQGETDGIIYKIDPTYYDDNGNYINTKIKTIRIDGGESKRKFVSKAEIIADKIAATSLLRYSDDDYQTWSVYRPIDMSAKRSMLLRGGHTRRRAYEFRCTASVPLRLGALELDMELGTS